MLVWQAHKGKIESLAFAADGGLLASATGGTRTVHLWEPTTGKLARKLTADWPDGRRLGPVRCVAFAPAAPLFAAGADRSVTVWRTDTWQPVAELGTSYGYYELAFGPGETPLLAASDSGQVDIWDEPARAVSAQVRRYDRQLDVGSYGVAVLDFSPDGKLLAATSHRAAAVFDPNPGATAKPRALTRPVGNHRGAVRFSPDGSVLALARGKYIDLWPTAGDSTQPAATLVAGTGRQPAVWALGWAAEGKVLMSAGADGFVRYWDFTAGKELRSFAWGIGKVYCAAFSPDGLTCAAGGENGQIVVWDVDI